MLSPSPGGIGRVKKEYGQIEPYVTKDGSVIRELIHPDQGVDAAMSLAEATVPPGKTTRLHVHRTSEEIYHIVNGTGRMTLGRDTFEAAAGDSILIRPGMPHRIENTGADALVILCCCSPAYAHEDTLLVEGMDGQP
jgi:mannose-6-phosphate isomerase-like protein (cupin superfamily)